MTVCLVCDDHELVRDGLALTLRRFIPDCHVLLASDFPTAWQQAQLKPDLCLCDLKMPGSEPFAGIVALQNIAPDMSVIVLTALEDDDLMWQLLQSGISGFVSKTESGRVLQSIVELVLAGGRHLPERLLDLVTRKSMTPNDQPTIAPTRSLTQQQSKVLSLISRGQTNKEIARELMIAPSTVKFHVDLLLRRFDARNRTEILTRASQAGLALS